MMMMGKMIKYIGSISLGEKKINDICRPADTFVAS